MIKEPFFLFTVEIERFFRDNEIISTFETYKPFKPKQMFKVFQQKIVNYILAIKKYPPNSGYTYVYAKTNKK